MFTFKKSQNINIHIRINEKRFGYFPGINVTSAALSLHNGFKGNVLIGNAPFKMEELPKNFHKYLLTFSAVLQLFQEEISDF